MSNTAKDLPFWVVANTSPRHFGEDHRCTSPYVSECDIDIPRTAADQYRNCEYLTDPRSSHTARWHRYWGRPSREERHNRYWAPERAKTREALGRVTREHRGGTDVETTAGLEELHHQHLHAPAGFDWWD